MSRDEPLHGIDPRDADLVDDLAVVIVSTEANWDREGSGPGSRFEGERREHAQARGVVVHLMMVGRLLTSGGRRAVSRDDLVLTSADVYERLLQFASERDLLARTVARVALHAAARDRTLSWVAEELSAALGEAAGGER